MADEEDIAALVIDNGSGMCKGTLLLVLACRIFGWVGGSYTAEENSSLFNCEVGWCRHISRREAIKTTIIRGASAPLSLSLLDNKKQ